jgi:hypothetical protein
MKHFRMSENEMGNCFTIPGYYLCNGDIGSVGDELFPASDEEPVISSEYELI